MRVFWTPDGDGERMNQREMHGVWGPQGVGMSSRDTSREIGDMMYLRGGGNKMASRKGSGRG